MLILHYDLSSSMQWSNLMQIFLVNFHILELQKIFDYNELSGKTDASKDRPTASPQRGTLFWRGATPKPSSGEGFETLTWLFILFSQVEHERLGTFFLERSSSSKSEYVKNSIMDYSGWLRKRIHPTDSEVIILHKP